MHRASRFALLLLCGLGFSRADAAVFSDVLPGARPMSLGAFTAVAEGPEAMFYNPAGLAGSDFTQAGASLGRLLSPVGPLSFEALTYARPLPVLPGATVGAGFLTLRQNNEIPFSQNRGGDEDAFLLHFSYPLRLPQIHLRMPLKVGGNVRVVDVDSGDGRQRLGVGADAGALLDSGGGFRLGLSLTGLTTQVGVPSPSLNLGAAYRLMGGLSLVSDLRVRPRLAQFFPGLEAEFFQQLLKVRLGKGLPLDGVSQVALGFGINFSPVVLDFAMAVPWNGFNRQGGGAQVSAGYKFGAPPFYGRFIGTAARRAEDLRSEIAELEERKKALQTQTDAAEADRTGLDGQVRALQDRLKDLQEKLRESESKLDHAQYELTHPPEVPRPAPVEPPRQAAPKPRAPKQAPAVPFPRQHLVKPGQTLRTIAQEQYGDPALWELLFEANPDKVERGMPVEGSVLTVPAPPSR